jgi:hypothetical protein
MAIDNELSETTKPRSGIGCLKIIGCGLFILALFAFIGAFWNHTQAVNKLQETLAELDRSDPGWRLEQIEAARADVPEEENSARVVIAAAGQMPKRWPSAGFPDEELRLLPSNELMSGEDFVRLSKELASAREALTIAGKLADMPRGRHRIHYERNPIATLLPDQQESRRIVSLLVYEAMRQNQRGDSKKALTMCRAALNAARSLGDEPIFISQLIRIAGVVIACQAIERTLGQGEPPPEDMSALQKLLEDEDAFSDMIAALRGERAAMHQVFEGIERGEISVAELEGLSRGGRPSESDQVKDTLISLWRMNTREDHALFFSLINQCIKDAQLPMHEQAAAERKTEQEIRAHIAPSALPGVAMITRLLLPAVSKIGEAVRRKHATVRCTIVALASERYRREKKTWPDKIDQLCPQFLAAVPLDPFDGKPLRYRRVKDGVIIYSVGQDAVDNGGNLDREHPISPGVDLGCRLWDMPKRRQPARPKPPPPEVMGGAGVAIPPNPK